MNVIIPLKVVQACSIRQIEPLNTQVNSFKSATSKNFELVIISTNYHGMKLDRNLKFTAHYSTKLSEVQQKLLQVKPPLNNSTPQPLIKTAYLHQHSSTFFLLRHSTTIQYLTSRVIPVKDYNSFEVKCLEYNKNASLGTEKAEKLHELLFCLR